MTKDSNKVQEHHDHSCCEDEEDIEHKVEHAIKELPTLQDKVQAIALNGYLQQKKALDKELEKELNIIDLKHRKTMEPLLAKINEIVEGKRELTPEDFAGVESLLTEQELEVRTHYTKAEKFQEYWLKALRNTEFGFQITEKDSEILKHLERIEGSKSEDETKLSLKFFFSENQWFTNTEIIKEFLLEGEEIKKSYGDAIQWKEGKNITIKVVKSKKKNKKTGEKKVSTKEVKQESFFHFFNPVDLDDNEEEENENAEGDEETEQAVEELEHQHQIAECIYSEVIPNSLALYLGIGGLGDLGDFADLGEGEDEEEEEARPTKKKSASKKKDSHNDDEDKSEKSKSKSKGKDKKQKKAKGGKGDPQVDCKNQ